MQQEEAVPLHHLSLPGPQPGSIQGLHDASMEGTAPFSCPLETQCSYSGKQQCSVEMWKAAEGNLWQDKST